MFRFAKAVDLHDETSWSAWGTRRRRLARLSVGSQSPACRRAHLLNTAVVPPTDFVRRGEAASETPQDCVERTRPLPKPPRAPREHLNTQQFQARRGAAPRTAPPPRAHHTPVTSCRNTPAAALPEKPPARIIPRDGWRASRAYP